jgi:hypothetical protein
VVNVAGSTHRRDALHMEPHVHHAESQIIGAKCVERKTQTQQMTVNHDKDQGLAHVKVEDIETKHRSMLSLQIEMLTPSPRTMVMKLITNSVNLPLTT